MHHCAGGGGWRCLCWRWRSAPGSGGRSRPPAAVAGVLRTGAAAPAAGSVMVLPLVMEGDSDASWARLGLMDFVADRLRQAGLPVLPSETVLGVLKEHAAVGDPRRLGEVSRTHWVVASRATRDSGSWRVQLEAGDREGVALRGASAEAGDLHRPPGRGTAACARRPPPVRAGRLGGTACVRTLGPGAAGRRAGQGTGRRRGRRPCLRPRRAGRHARRHHRRHRRPRCHRAAGEARRRVGAWPVLHAWRADPRIPGRCSPGPAPGPPWGMPRPQSLYFRVNTANAA